MDFTHSYSYSMTLEINVVTLLISQFTAVIWKYSTSLIQQQDEQDFSSSAMFVSLPSRRTHTRSFFLEGFLKIPTLVSFDLEMRQNELSYFSKTIAIFHES